MADILAVASGSMVGFLLGLLGGGGSILAVSVSAFANLIGHARTGNVKWPCASVFAAAGVAGAYLGSTIGKQVGGDYLLFLFAML